MSTEKRLLKIKKLTKDYGEPVIDPFNYKISLMVYLNYHTTNTNDATKRQWAEKYLEENYPDKKIPNAEDREFRVLGTIARLVFLDSYLEEAETSFLDLESNRVLSLKRKIVEVEEDVSDKKDRSESIERTVKIKTSEFLGEFEGLVDDFTSTGTMPNIQALISTMGVTNRMVGRITEYAERKKAYYDSVIGDKELLEYYSFSKPTLKKISGLYATLIEKLSQNKKIREPRARKEKPAGVLVQSLKHLVKEDTLGLRSVPAANLIGATEAYLYRVEGRKLQYFKAVDGQTLTVKGTTILNYDESKSYQKTIRKPEVLKDFVGKGKMDSRRFIKDINSAEGGLAGRTSDDTLILAVFK